MTRARYIGVPFDGETGPDNAITDVAGVMVGHATLIAGEGRIEVGKGPVRTGVTAILPRPDRHDSVFAGWYSLNGNGEMTGTIWVEESGFLQGPVMLTNTHSVGVVRDAVIPWLHENRPVDPRLQGGFWSLPVVAETYDGRLNDINGFHVKPEHVFQALNTAAPGPVQEGSVGGGTGMICHGFKGGIGTASRKPAGDLDAYTIGVLVQANYGSRENLTIAGVPVGRELTDLMPVYNTPGPEPGSGSIIGILATDAPLLPHQLKRLARRIPLGLARVGGMGANTSGDIFLAFSTANPGAARVTGVVNLDMLPNDRMTPLFEAAVQASEEAIVNAMWAAETMIGINGNTVHGLPRERVTSILKKYNRLAEK